MRCCRGVRGGYCRQIKMLAGLRPHFWGIHEAIAAHPDAVIHGWEVGDDVAPLIVGDDHLGKFGREFDALGDHPHASFWPVWARDVAAISELAMQTENYFRLGLEPVTQSDGAKLLVFYCLRDCWMSWNAAKRALALGYKNVAWYPDGTDGWEAAELPLQEAKPEPASVQ